MLPDIIWLSLGRNILINTNLDFFNLHDYDMVTFGEKLVRVMIKVLMFLLRMITVTKQKINTLS